MTDAEQTLLTIADPLPWQWQELMRIGYWVADYDGIRYIIRPPVVSAADVDTCPFDALHSLVTTDLGIEHKTWVPSLEDAKAVCLRYALTRDRTEWDTLREPVEREGTWFQAQKQETQQHLFLRYDLYKTPPLAWTPDEKTALKFSAAEPPDTYTLCFDPVLRWVVTHAEDNSPASTRRFLTRQIAQKACVFHAFMGQWLGTIREEERTPTPKQP